MTSKPKLRGHLLSFLNYTMPKSQKSKEIDLVVKTSLALQEIVWVIDLTCVMLLPWKGGQE